MVDLFMSLKTPCTSVHVITKLHFQDLFKTYKVFLLLTVIHLHDLIVLHNYIDLCVLRNLLIHNTRYNWSKGGNLK